MTPKQLQSSIKRLEKEREKVGKVRDSLRDTFDELEALKECCERAYEDIDSAIQALSELA